MTIDPIRLASAATLVVLYLGMCAAILRSRLAKRDTSTGSDWLVLFASQTGTCEYFANQTATTLRTGGLSVACASVDQVDPERLRSVERVLFVVSTYGEGDAPDSAAGLMRFLEQDGVQLDHLHYGVLALGDSSYTHFCGFGRQLDDTLQARGAQPLFARVEVDRSAPPAIETWQHHLSHLAGTSDAPDWSAPAYEPWRVASRRQLNPGSAGAPAWHIVLAAPDGTTPQWQAGDLAQVSAPGEPDYPREYSIASIPSDGAVELLVRLHARPDGAKGVASSWLCEEVPIGGAISLRLRPHSRFQAGLNAKRPMILIGNGTGIAGLRAHLKQRIASGHQRNWLMFGERSARHDYFFESELAGWVNAGSLQTDLAFSRDGGQCKYVQHVLEANAEQVRAWTADGAAIYVCGSLQGMAASVQHVLCEILGPAQVQQMAADGRYRRDVY